MSLKKNSSKRVRKKGVLRNFAKFTAKHLCQALSGTGVFPVNFVKFLGTFFYGTPLVVASEFKRKIFLLLVTALLPYNNKWVNAPSFIDRRFGLKFYHFAGRTAFP